MVGKGSRKLQRIAPLMKKEARYVSDITGRSFFYHFLDGLWCVYRYGTSVLHYGTGGMYRMRPYDRRQTYTKRRGVKLREKLNDPSVRHWLMNKPECNAHYAAFMNRAWLFTAQASAEEILSFVRQQGTVFVKTVNQARGQGAGKLEAATFTAAMAEEMAGQPLLLEQYLVQHPAMVVGNKSVNTIRLVTMIDRSGTVHLLKAMLRCGVGESVVDNFSSGGIAYPVDLETGVVEGPGIQVAIAPITCFYYHPGTQIMMVGRQIPFWAEALEMARQAALVEPRIRFVGWDIAITPAGPELVEGNTLPDSALLDMTGRKRCLYREIKLWI